MTISQGSNAASLKDAAVKFLQLASSGKVKDAFERYVAPTFIHHNAHFPGDAESLKAGMAENARMFPEKEFHILRVLQDGDMVVTHSKVRPKPQLPYVAVVHIFRFEGDRMVELWDVGQPEPAQSPNVNGMF